MYKQKPMAYQLERAETQNKTKKHILEFRSQWNTWKGMIGKNRPKDLASIVLAVESQRV